MSHVMLDIETMGTDPYAPVIAIGACRFEMGEGWDDIAPEYSPDNVFYQAITLQSCMDVGLRPSASTTLWWMQREAAAQHVMFDPAAVALPAALDAFTDWLNSRPDMLWGNSARFDCGLLEACYKACGKVVPWDHWNERCYRTIKNLPKAKEIKLIRIGTYHHALDDAISQANHLRAIYQLLGL